MHNIKIFNHILKILLATLDIELKNCPSGLGSVDQTKSLSDGGLRFRERGEGVSKGWIPNPENEGGLSAGLPTCWSSCPRTGGEDMGSQGEGER